MVADSEEMQMQIGDNCASGAGNNTDNLEHGLERTSLEREEWVVVEMTC